MPIANIADQARVIVGRRHNAARGTDDRLKDKGRYVARAEAQNLLLEFPRAVLGDLEGATPTGGR